MQPTDLAVISEFCTQLALRPDGDRVRWLLAEVFYDHRANLWPVSTVGVSRDWIEDHVDEVLATVERLYQHATRPPVAQEFIDRMSWLPALLRDLEPPVPFDA